MFNNILSSFGINADDSAIVPFGSGLINGTWKVSVGDDAYILQRINTKIFKSPQAIANNLVSLQTYLVQTAPAYIFAAPRPTLNGDYLVIDDNQYYRLQPFIKNSHTVDVVSEPAQAFEAAKQFGKFSRLLNDFDANSLQYTLPDFHNLTLRVDQFKSALKNATADRIDKATDEIKEIEKHEAIADTYRQLVDKKEIPLRVIHHDTKINNVLFDADNKGLCVIDLDTVMPGYFISDVGDMMRTYLSPANEEEKDLDKVFIQEDNFTAIYKGYMAEMGDVLTSAEKNLFFYSGKFMIYMQAVRFLADYLNGDIYYHTTYPGQNLVRAQNQLSLLNKYIATKFN
ncbi:MAG: aminoglycoside phosphotransferase family protein [Bacteroidota bacterium]